MREPNKKYVYSLEDLTSDEKIELGNRVFEPQNVDNVFKFPYIRYDKDFKKWLATKCVKPTTNAKELFYTLENIQVDCRELSEEKIKEMADVFEKAGYCYFQSDKKFSLNIIDDNYYLHIYEGEIIIDCMVEGLNEITYEKFMELFGRKEENFKKLVEVLNEELTEEAYKETYNKLNYELDFNFITQLAERMAQNKHKYEPYNWQKLDNIDELKQALFRHVLEVMKVNYEDDKRLFGHLESISLNCMFINYQLNKQQ